MASRIVMPSFGMYTAEGQLVAWLEADGSAVQAGQPVLEIETQKSTEAVISPASGILRHVASRGAQVKEEDLLGYILAEGESSPGPTPSGKPGRGSASPLPTAATRLEVDPVPSRPGPKRLIASPVARRLAKEQGVNLAELSGSGPGGRIVESDVRAAVEGRNRNGGTKGAEPSPRRSVGLPTAAIAPGKKGQVQTQLTFESQTLRRSVRYAVYLPADYETSQRAYPVIYLLHGYADNELGWVQFGEVEQVADKAIAEGGLPPVILVMPDAGVSFYINNHDGLVRYEDFFVHEFMPGVEARFRVKPGNRSRAVAGISMGGFGALVYALRHPERFAACAAFSPAILTDEEFEAESEQRWARVYGDVYGPTVPGAARITEHLKANCPLHLAQHNPPEALTDLKLYVDCADDDLFYKGHGRLHSILREQKIAHEYRVSEGGHTWAYWKTRLPEVLRFLGASVHP